ncbi:hypothetical protein LIER_34898 [Lithospermum erythrorhizon]|uniref:Uncharacterized protein n=1 Tax=Lithospermum erythrorhizon TaxID=34254 RepID=A0AAV3S3I4_LITER
MTAWRLGGTLSFSDGQYLVELRACLVAKMGELLTDPVFATWLARMKTALEDFFTWVDLLAFFTWVDLDHARLEAFNRELAESEHLLRRYRETPPSYAMFCPAASCRRLQESIVYALQKRQHLMADEIHHLEEAIDQARYLRNSQ